MTSIIRRILVFALPLVLFASFASACTGAYVGADVSFDGTTILARCEDSHPLAGAKRFIVVDRVENQPGRVYEAYDGFSWPHNPTTYRYTATPAITGLGIGNFCAACTNECGLAITATVTGYVKDEAKKADPPVEGGLSESTITDLIAANCATALEGVELIGEVMRERGSSENNIAMIADPNEAWYVEMYMGHQWAAVKMPRDCVAVFGNQFMLEYIDPESDDVRCSEELFDLPRREGFAVYGPDGRMNLFYTYAGRLADYANRRTWRGHQLLAPSSAGEYDTNTKYPLFYEPDEAVTLEQLMALYRDRFEGTPFDPNVTHAEDTRVIGTESQFEVHILQVHSDLPAEMACVTWLCMANAEHSVFLPMSSLITRTTEAYAKDSDVVEYNKSLAHTHFKRLNTLCEQNREYAGQGVRDYWREYEKSLRGTFPTILNHTAELYKASPEAAKEYITQYCLALQTNTIEIADSLFDQVLWYLMNTTDTLGRKFNYNTLTYSADNPRVPFVVDKCD